MTSEADWPELEDQLDRMRERKKRNRRVVSAIAAIIISGVIMAAGVVVIGGAEKVKYGMDTAYSYWSTPQFEIGVFIALIGTVMMTVSANLLITSWRIPEVRKRKGV